MKSNRSNRHVTVKIVTNGYQKSVKTRLFFVIFEKCNRCNRIYMPFKCYINNYIGYIVVYIIGYIVRRVTLTVTTVTFLKRVIFSEKIDVFSKIATVT